MARDIVAYCNSLSKTEFWSLGMGDIQNLLDEALEEIERLREGLQQAYQCCARPASTCFDPALIDGAL